MKLVSDVYTSCEGKLMVEWEYLTGGRWREEFPTEEAREYALHRNEVELKAHEAEVEAHLKEEAEWLAKMEAEYYK